MKVAELLIRKGVLKKQVTELEASLVGGIRIPETEVDGQEDIELILKTIQEKYDEMHKLGCIVGKCNHVNEVAPGQTVDDALVMRDILIKQLTALREAYRECKGGRGGYRSCDTEVKYVTRIPPTRLRTMIDQKQSELYALETKIQIANWAADVDAFVSSTT